MRHVVKSAVKRTGKGKEMKAKIIKGLCGLVLATVCLPSHSALIGRDLDGNASTFEAYYDDVLKITWLGDANAGAGSTYDNGSSTTDGRMTWDNADAWAKNLDV